MPAERVAGGALHIRPVIQRRDCAVVPAAVLIDLLQFDGHFRQAGRGCRIDSASEAPQRHPRLDCLLRYKHREVALKLLRHQDIGDATSTAESVKAAMMWEPLWMSSGR